MQATVVRKNKTNIVIRNRKESLSKRIWDYLVEVSEIVTPGMIIMNGGYYRPAGGSVKNITR